MFAIHAPAKVNLYLHVGPVRPDGRHPLDSLVVFADSRASDRLEFEPGQDAFTLSVTGPIISGQIGPLAENLVMRAVRALEARTGKEIKGRLTLEKRLPIAAGIGGGSADAAATLLLLNAVCEFGLSQADLIELARPLGGDVPACVTGEPVLMRGDGAEVLLLDRALPALPAILYGPGIVCPTGPVFKAFDRETTATVFAEIPPPQETEAVAFLKALKTGYRNDLQIPAISLLPEIAEALENLSRHAPCAFTAMSGSGATCFACFQSDLGADNALRDISRTFSGNWLVRTELGKAGFDPIGFSL